MDRTSPSPRFTVATHNASDGYIWSYRQYLPSQMELNTPPPRVVCLHGIQSHAGWYDASSTRLADAGFEVLFLDRRGSGINRVARGDTPSFRRLLDDIGEFLRSLPPAPTTLLAISWGGKLAVALQRRHPGLVQRLALICPGFFPRLHPPLSARLRIALSYLVAPSRRFPIPLNDPELFTASPSWQQFLRNDPLALHEATARFLAHSVRLDRYLRGAAAHVAVPTLLLLAGQDRIIDNARTRRFVESFATKDKTILEYPEAQHTLEFEPTPQRFLEDLLCWLGRGGVN